MKTIGRTAKHNAIVEMTPEEHRLISYLVQVMSGMDYGERPTLRYENDIQEIDLSPAFEAIITFAKGKAIINSLADCVEQLDEIFMQTKTPK